jgi:rhamnose transport system permease protein
VSASTARARALGAGRLGGAGARGLVDMVVRIRELGLLLVLALVIGGTALVNPRFVNAQGVRDLLLNASIVALLAVGMTMVVITRNVDLSVGSVLGFTAFAVGDLFLRAPGTPVVAALAFGLAVGAAWGVLNGLLVSIGRVPSLVVTLGTLYLIRGVDFAWAQGRQVNASDLPRAFLALGSEGVLGVPWLGVITLLTLVAATVYLRRYRSGRELYAIGSNPDAAVLAGIPVGKRVFAAFVLTGALAGLAGVLWAARYGTVDATVGNGFELGVVAAVVVGGVNINGGSGTVLGAAIGAVLLSAIGSALIVLRVPSFWQLAINGGLLLAAIALDRLVGLRVAGALRRRRAREASGTPGQDQKDGDHAA